MLSQGKSSQIEAIQNDPRWLLAQRVAGSALLHRSPRLKALLLYVAEQALARPGEPLNEHQIGCAVFERPEDYSPGEDNIVRVQARHLRARLEEYFAGEGRDETLVLEIPKGGYLPIFRAREEVVAVEAPMEATRGTRWFRWLAFAAGIAVAVWAGWLLRGVQTAGRVVGETSWILELMFAGNEPVRLVPPDSSFGLIQGFVGKNLTLSDYLSPGYPGEFVRNALKDADVRRRANAVASRPYTTYSDLVIASQASVLAERRGWKLTMAFPRQVTPREIESGHYILVGSSKSNPWTSLFEQGMQFQSFYDSTISRGGIRNLKAGPGETREYMTEPRHGYSGEAYALVGLHLKKNSRVLTLAGTNMEGTEAAWEFVSTPEKARVLLDMAKWERLPEGEARLEAVLRTYVLAGAARDTTVVAVRAR